MIYLLSFVSSIEVVGPFFYVNVETFLVLLCQQMFALGDVRAILLWYTAEA
jgi:hypothetical protein